ncbi:hypothetical protein QR680_005402 [Steinernema hermaphroditum]|uniref:PH domain-containing protein n=1 Tax=Steinernema hermaphroditum TaxID=289476 RepID=A0AA39LVL3_9BILA|nr:hypothetical protein QR680_005402 [Steinernema hermaphroditum]
MESTMIVKEGVLVKSRNHGVRLAFLKAQWVARYFVLRRVDASGQYVLDQYWKKSKRKIKKTLELDRCTKVESYLKLSESAARQGNFEWIFALHYSKRDSERRAKLFLAANSKEEMDSWVFELCRCCKFLADDADSYLDSSTSNGVTPLLDRSRRPTARLPLSDLHSEDSFLVDTPMSECGTGSIGIGRLFEDATASLPLTARPKTSIDLHIEDDEERERFFVIQFPIASTRKCTVRSSPLVSPSNENPPTAFGSASIVAAVSKATASSNYIHIRECGSLPRRAPLPPRVSEGEDVRSKENTNPYMHLYKCGTMPPKERFVRSGAATLSSVPSTTSQHSQKPSLSSVSAFSEDTSPSSSQRSIAHTDPETESSSGFDSFGSVPPPLPPKISARSSIDSMAYSDNRSLSRGSPPLPLAPPIPGILNLDTAVPARFPDDYDIDTSGETIVRRRTPSPPLEEAVPVPKTTWTAPPIDRSTKPARIQTVSRSSSYQSTPASPLSTHSATRPNFFNFRDVDRVVPVIPRTNPKNRVLNKQLTSNDLFLSRPQKPLPMREALSQCSSPVVSRPSPRSPFSRSPAPTPNFVLDYFEPHSPNDLATPPPELDSVVPCAPRSPLAKKIDYVDVDHDRTQAISKAIKCATVERNAL